MPEPTYKAQALDAEHSVREYAAVIPAELLSSKPSKAGQRYSDWVKALIESSFAYLGFASMHYLQVKDVLPVTSSTGSLRDLLRNNAPSGWEDFPEELKEYFERIDVAHAYITETARAPKTPPWSDNILPVWCTRFTRCVKANLLI